MTPVEVLKKYWGHSSFRPLQEEIVDSILSGRDTLGLMPTGGGKSITFQVPGLMLEGLTVVVTPLISLMKDQVDNLRRHNIRAIFMHSGMTPREKNIAMEHLTNGRARFLYIAPERLSSERFMSQLKLMRIALIVVDEAHCISQWGYDFRPSYLRIKALRKVASDAPVLALTATATPEVASDICRHLEMKNPALFRMSFRRTNISYIVRKSETKLSELFHILSNTSGSGIVYVRSRKRTGEIADYLNASGISAEAYHAGLDYELKEHRQNLWKTDAIRIMVATNAFGMGIDKPDVRTVVHYDLPPSIEEYYQEAGRAGRDGLPSYAVLLVSRHDPGVLRRKVSENFPDRKIIRKIYERTCNFLSISLDEGYESVHEFDIERFCRTFDYNPRQCLAALHLLGQAGYMEYIDDPDRRAKAMILITREELYNLQDISDIAEMVLGRMLRLYPGLFMDYRPISEATIAVDLNLSPQQVYEALLELSRDKIISYIPRSRVPVIYLPTSREEPQHIQIGRDIYENRKQRLSLRTEAMIDYAVGHKYCRENLMLEYFGEHAATKCGHCDVCRDKKPSPTANPEAVMRQILNMAACRPAGLDYRIIEHTLHAPSTMIARVLSFLCSEGYLTIKDGLYFPANRQ